MTTLDERTPKQLLEAAAAAGRELSVVERLFLEGVRVVDPAAAKRHMRREWWKAELKLWVWPAVFAAIAGLLFLAYQHGPFGQNQNLVPVEFVVEFFGIMAAGVLALVTTMGAVGARPHWVEYPVVTARDLPPVARHIPAKVAAALGEDAELAVDKLERRRVLDPGLRLVIGGEQHYLLFYDTVGLPIDLPTIDPFDRAA